MTREAAEAIPRTNVRMILKTWMSYAALKAADAPAGASSPMFASIGPLIGQPVIATGMTAMTKATAASHATGFHRRDGSRPYREEQEQIGEYEDDAGGPGLRS